MSYETSFAVEWDSGSLTDDQVAEALAALDCNMNTRDTELDRRYWEAIIRVAETTWYNHEEDMAKLSAQFPGVLFTVHRSGEQPEDLERLYFWEGKVQREPAVIT